ncbi:GIDE domain-containing protein [Streptomyces otsuchiensis]|uniref:GIDE domain-containing protein n=1 Tax=Streptomyces otsuchiensis TaxID=2681388 RepID=UPI001030C1BC|nr:GIDE domain-containing protein [Streptomyces otsuchiensis]
MIWIGVIALVFAVVCFFAARSAEGRSRALTRVETLPVNEVVQLHQAASSAAGPGQFRYACEVVGTAQPAGGPLISQLDETECVWHRHKVTHKYWETVRDSEGRSKRQERSRVVSENTSTADFLVQDATGTIQVSPGRGVDKPQKVLDNFEQATGRRARTVTVGSLSLNLGSSSGSIGYRYEEWALLPGQRVFVHGEATDAGGRLAIGPPSEGGLYLVSTRSQEELLKSETTKVRGFRAGAGVLGAAGLVLLVLGLVS